MKLTKWFAPAAMTTALIVAACGGSTATSTPGTAASTAPTTAASQAATTPAASVGVISGATANCVAGSIIDGGSTALQPLAEAARDQFQALCPGSTIDVQGGGSGTGLTQVAAGAFQIGNSDVFAAEKLATPQPADALVDHQIARQGWIMVTNTNVTGVTNLTTAQAIAIWTGTTTNWKDVGGPDMPIVLIIRPASSGTRAVFRKIVLGGANEASGQALTEDSNGAVTTAVQNTPGSTSVIGFAYYQSNKAGLNGLQLDGIDATVANMQNGSYKLQAFGHMYTNGEATGLAKSFIDFILSGPIQSQLLPQLFYAPIQ